MDSKGFIKIYDSKKHPDMSFTYGIWSAHNISKKSTVSDMIFEDEFFEKVHFTNEFYQQRYTDWKDLEKDDQLAIKQYYFNEVITYLKIS